MLDSTTDQQFLRQALDLARQGLGLASPNPYVGAVIVDGLGQVAGIGVYTYAGIKHAEVLALEQAGDNARGGTLYINLEPHAHQGRTPPCTVALISAGVQRVVASMTDPNPKVSGLGFEKLRAAGIQVAVGALETEARRLNEAFARYIRRGVPLITLKSAMTLDGKIAPPLDEKARRSEGVPAGGWITGEAARAHVHEQRHQSDAIIVGVGTVLADDPWLTDRSEKPRRRKLLRVILDSHLCLPLASRLVRSVAQNVAQEGNGSSDLLIFCSSGDDAKRRALEERGVRIEELSSSGDGRPDLHQVVERLGQLEITNAMIEGGSAVNSAALASGVVDKVLLYYAPKIMAEAEAVPFAITSDHSRKVTKIHRVSLHRFGEDFAVEGYIREPYED